MGRKESIIHNAYISMRTHLVWKCLTMEKVQKFGTMRIKMVETSTGAFEVRVKTKDGSSITIRDMENFDRVAIHPRSEKIEYNIFDNDYVTLDSNREFINGKESGFFQCIVVNPVSKKVF